ncbi:hypothetical protein O181_031115 [Austropuccinia psidii MF-1]|uniref:Chromo domain-containing protein n=1 Tax=Austropuccinia psidii MF-1 TaxID=1389203 RepID=A0A9Q3CXD5_9BASI|nr:hypothetical protein [Austropuccinia psidii MF-1]
MDSITQLQLYNSFDSVLVIVDRFSKMAVFIPTMCSITSLDLAYVLIKNIFSNHGLHSTIVSDRGSLFVSSFWTNHFQQIKISKDLSTSHHPETDGQTERVNQILAQYLWMYGRDPHFDSVHITQDTPAGNTSTKIQSVQQDVKRELEVSINRFKRYADESRASKPVFHHGDMVWLSSKNTKSTRTTKKCLKDGQKYIHPVFHIFLLEPVKTSKIPNRHKEPPPSIIIEQEEEWEVSKILHSSLKRGKVWSLVEWKGFSQDPERSTWEPTENFYNFAELIKNFHSLYPDKPGQNSSRA